MKSYKDTGYRDELNTPIYEGDTVMIDDKTEGQTYLALVMFNPDFGGWCIKLTAVESLYSGTGWVSMAGFAVTQWRTFKQFKRRFTKRLRFLRLSVRTQNAFCGMSHMQYAG